MKAVEPDCQTQGQNLLPTMSGVEAEAGANITQHRSQERRAQERRSVVGEATESGDVAVNSEDVSFSIVAAAGEEASRHLSNIPLRDVEQPTSSAPKAVDEENIQNIARNRQALVGRSAGSLREGRRTPSTGSSHENQSSGASDVAGGGIGGDESVAHIPSRGLVLDEDASQESRFNVSQDFAIVSHLDEGTMKGGWGYSGNKILTKEEMANIVGTSRIKWGSDPQV